MPDFTSLQFRPFRDDDLLLAALGQVAIARHDDGLVLRLDGSARAANPGGFIHGGAIATLFDVALYEAARAGFGAPTVTAALEIKFLRAGDPQAPIHVETRTLRAGRSLTTCTGSAYQGGRLIAYATAQFVKAGPAAEVPAS
ncbi:PaaI family thioesterase [Paracoccus aminovorans]|uniref:PaaI family thioesterase n=1 Tax=Paracoccus aminovorans TaxID=34004 RepID=UPI001552AE78|nr:PaaI family thioesterase [Paracoccus aminovorans]